METSTRHLSRRQLASVYRRKQSKYYQQEGYRYALNVSNAFLLERIFAFALDTCVMFLPIALWEFCMLLMFVGVIPVILLNGLEWATLIALAISMFTFNPLLSAKSGGQTLGKYFYDLKVVKKNHKEASHVTLIAREIFGFTIPALLLFIFFNIIGVIAFWILNFLFLLIHPYHISIIDLFLNTRIVVLRTKTKQRVRETTQKPQPETVKNTIDLHMHSNFSDDGSYNVEDLFQMAAKRGLKTISICDHNSVKANLSARRMSELYHIEYVNGVELDCRYQDVHLRVLGYFINASTEIYNHLENESLKHEKNASLRRVEAFRRYTGIRVDVDALLTKNRYQNISGEMIAQQVLANPSYRDHPMLAQYHYGEKRENSVYHMNQDFFVKGAPCYVEVHHPKLEDILDVIQLTGGVAVLSKPSALLEQEGLLEEIIAKGIAGIEVFTPYHDDQEMAKLLKLAKEHQLFITAGSDFHGQMKPDHHLGETNCPPAAEKLVKQFLDAHRKPITE